MCKSINVKRDGLFSEKCSYFGPKHYSTDSLADVWGAALIKSCTGCNPETFCSKLTGRQMGISLPARLQTCILRNNPAFICSSPFPADSLEHLQLLRCESIGADFSEIGSSSQWEMNPSREKVPNFLHTFNL